MSARPKMTKTRVSATHLVEDTQSHGLGVEHCRNRCSAEPHALTSRWARMLKAAGVGHIRHHDARHTSGTLMHLQDVPIAVISAWLGHASEAFTMATYVHSQPEALATAAQSFSQVVGHGQHPNYQPRDVPAGRPRKALNPQTWVQSFSCVLRHHVRGRCRIRTCVGVS